MFICKACHKTEEREYGCVFDNHFSFSTGRCETCGKVGRTVDCKAYKYRERRPSTPVSPVTGGRSQVGY